MLDSSGLAAHRESPGLVREKIRDRKLNTSSPKGKTQGAKFGTALKVQFITGSFS